VTRSPSLGRTWTRGVFLALAILALALKVMVPAGFMTQAEPRNGLPFALVLCTGQGPLVVQPGDALDPHDKSPADKPGHDAPCPFASHGATAPPPSTLAVAKVEFVAYRPMALARAVDPVPGRGLAAPPLPARGPPSLLI
jgi:hypothetical protein